MKKIFISCLLSFASFILVAQEGHYFLETYHQFPATYPVRQIFALEGQMWTRFSVNDYYGTNYFNGSSWTTLTSPDAMALRGKKFNDHLFFVGATDWQGCRWNNQLSDFDYFSTPVNFLSNIFVFDENNVYLCTRKKSDDQLADFYHWNGEIDEQKEFTKLGNVGDGVSFRGLHARGPNDILLFYTRYLGEGLFESGFFHYDGSSLQKAHVFDFNATFSAHSLDGNIFFLLLSDGNIAIWDHDQQEERVIYSDPEDYGKFYGGLIVKDNENIFSYGSGGIRHTKVSTGEAQVLKIKGNDWYVQRNIESGYYDPYSDRLYFGGSKGQIYEVKMGGNNAILPAGLSDKVSLYPNPASHQLTLSADLSGPKTVVVYNLIGAQVLTQSISAEGDVGLDISFLPAGVYLLKLQTLHGTTSKKFIKQ